MNFYFSYLLYGKAVHLQNAAFWLVPERLVTCSTDCSTDVMYTARYYKDEQLSVRTAIMKKKNLYNSFPSKKTIKYSTPL